MEKCIAAIQARMKYPTAICTYENEIGCPDVGWVAAVHKLLEGINGIVFILGDDAIVEPECIERLYEVYMSIPDREEWLLQPYEQFHKGELATFPFCHSDILKKYIYKGYKHLWSDTELTNIMRAKGRYGKVIDAKVTHVHYLENKDLFDETYAASLNNNGPDHELYNKRKANGFEPKNII